MDIHNVHTGSTNIILVQKIVLVHDLKFRAVHFGISITPTLLPSFLRVRLTF
jgi:hypothetical protein